jgi:hypothetical protein
LHPPNIFTSQYMRQTFANALHLANFAFYILMEITRSIPLCTRRLDDCWAWHYEKNGILTVCSAYRLFVQIKRTRVEWLERRTSSFKQGLAANLVFKDYSKDLSFLMASSTPIYSHRESIRWKPVSSGNIQTQPWTIGCKMYS